MVQGLGSGVKEVTSTAKGTVCVVDDDRFFLQALVRLLRGAGLETVSFENPRLFLEYVKDHSVSLAIIHLRVPELTPSPNDVIFDYTASGVRRSIEDIPSETRYRQD